LLNATDDFRRSAANGRASLRYRRDAVMQDFAALAHLNMSITPSALYTPDQCPAHHNPRIHADHVDPEPLAPVA
jgi:hypothetical protein